METGTVINQYKIISAIGKGGMGEVFLAQDTKLDRKVAIKFLNQEFSKDADKLNRFIQEAKAASALNHPNILTIHEIGEHDGTNYIVTELIDGKTLREQLHKESLQLNQILKIGVQVAEALSAAHTAGIVHRDIKPENIMIRKDGYAKVLDFGLAKLSEPGAVATGSEVASEDATRVQVNTTPGMVMGTVSYMSPEQARGNLTDARTDIWSLGIVLYEMLAGKVPFSGETVNHTIVSILEKEPLQLESITGELQRIVRKSLTKDVDMRYQSARDLLIDLKNLRRELDIQGELERSTVPNRETASTLPENATQMLSGGESTISGQNAATQNVTTSSSSLEYAVTQAKSHKLVTAFAAVLLVGVIAAVGYFGFLSKGSSSGQISSIAVLPFVNASGDQETDFLSDGIAETLINNFTKIPSLRVTARSTAFRYKGKDTEPQTIGKELNVAAILTGKVILRANSLSVQVDLVDVSTGAQIWGNQYSGNPSEILNVQQSIARDVSEQLKLKLSGAQELQLTRNYTVNPEAFQHYLKGRFYWNKRTAENLNRAIEQFNAAAEKDPNYALAYVGLADSYVVLENYAGTPPNEVLPQAKAFASRALAIDDSLAEAHVSLAFIYEQLWEWTESEKEFKRAIALNPNYPTAHHWYSLYLNSVGRFDEAAVEIRRAKELDPVSNIINQNVMLSLLYKNDYKSTIENGRKQIELDPNFGTTWTLLGQAFLLQRSNPEAIAAMEKGVELSSRSVLTLGDLGYGYAVTGKRAEATAIIKELEAKHAEEKVVGQYIAAVYAGFGEMDEAFAWLEKDFQAHSGQLARIRLRPAFATLRSDPRFADLLRRMGLPQ